jgi:stearoyl-CoA desaturase (delta-9 desaturase)
MASKPQPSHTEVAASSDGTTDYQPLRSGAYDMKKPHITELPMTWRNWYQHLDWLSIYFILIVPISGLIAATQVSLQLYTGIFAVVYYVICGSGITAGMSTLIIHEIFCYVLTPKQDIIVSGLTRAIKRPFRSKYTWQLLELVQLKEASDGGREAIELIIDTQIHQKTLTL